MTARWRALRAAIIYARIDAVHGERARRPGAWEPNGHHRRIGALARALAYRELMTAGLDSSVAVRMVFPAIRERVQWQARAALRGERQ